MKRTYRSEAQAEAAKEKAARFVGDVLDDPDRASEIEGESLDEWLEETGRRIQPNPKTKRRKVMPKARKTPAEYAAEIRALKDERDALSEENDELNTLLDDIQDLSGSDEDDDDVDTDDDDDE
jgi:predicted RNase H-like nuclease (RuvC/YqgF family)